MAFPLLEAWRKWRNRNRYDLNKLRIVDERQKARPEEPEADAPTAAPRNHAYCRHCDSSMSQAYSICPHCGIPLGS